MAPRNMLARKGPWVLVAAVGLYIACNVVLDIRFTAQRRILEKERNVTERIDAGQLTTVSIDMPNVSDERSIDSQYHDQAYAIAGYDKVTMQLQMRAEGRTLHITLGVANGSRYGGRDGFKLVLPTTIKTLILKNKVQGQVAKNSQNLTHKLTELSIVLDDCDSRATVAEIDVEALRLSRACRQIGDLRYRSVMFAIDGAQVKKLDAFMRYGALTVTPQSLVETLSLDVTDDVLISAPANVLRKAQWAKVPVGVKVP